MQETNKYRVTWKVWGSIRIQRTCDMKPVQIKNRYNVLCSLVGAIGWVPSILFETVFKIENSILRFFLSVACFCVFFFLVMYAFYIFLRAKNCKGKIEKYIELDANQ